MRYGLERQIIKKTRVFEAWSRGVRHVSRTRPWISGLTCGSGNIGRRMSAMEHRERDRPDSFFPHFCEQFTRSRPEESGDVVPVNIPKSIHQWFISRLFSSRMVKV
jgi:hypothetical protein